MYLYFVYEIKFVTSATQIVGCNNIHFVTSRKFIDIYIFQNFAI